MNKLSPEMPELQSMNITADNITKLKSLFPEAFNENGIDFDVLKQLLGENVDEKEERYGLNWHGKRQARQLALTPSRGTLRPCKDESVDWHNTKNLMIEGDNLEVLKLLQKSYAGKVKLIYIDPPYNTGKDFVYPDNFQDNMKNYLEITGQTEDGARLSTNTETSGRYHTDWLNMIYPRLKLARNLLKEDGVIFISIDDTEVDNLKKVCSEIFGEENFVANIVWQKKYSPQNDATYFSDMHDHILVYAKQRKTSKNDSNGWNIDFLPRSDEQNAAYKNPDNDPRGVWKSVDLSVKTYSKANDYSITTPSGRIVTPPASRCWQVSEKRFVELCKENKIWFGENGNNVPSIKRFLTEVQDGVVPTTWWSYKECGHNQEAKQELKKLMEGESVFFDTPKPLRLLDRILHLATTNDKDCIILDFFAGSGTTAHATLNKNIADSGSRRYIAVQLPEKIDDEKYYTISELTKERLRRAGKKVREDNPEWKGDVGFRVFKLDTSNIRPWEATAETLSEQLDAYVSPILEGRSEEDLLTELMLKRGIDLSVNVEVRQFDGLTVSCVDGGKLFTCFTRQIPASSVEALTKGIIDWHKSLKAGKDTVCYFLDDAFENNVAKTNLCAILEQHGLTNLHSL
ncbi:site-specific DNA-methyltransferase [Escherichia coli]|uniref:site-specific DNA-methyltransferase n=1 Tax=Enterobacteriaceae TaxID=543 RepID=UPI0003B9D053|nr:MULTISPECIES: site-specific DNA-methyltransferase [Enterobacteriaceae]EFT1001160.1 site-specific DNA-methyltransferase [Shigella sonnei]ESA27087.1 Type III restriction-modification system methylation subunit [Escherichia coli SCD1]HED2914250.1 site-specific DNA-methyltransferase [Klebsiella variicola subsp. variicola]ALQ45954.1 Type III restriction-modification system methylation subunit [Raoultella ornithinolytica]EAC1891057.1 site-specific DNA-methyltransferase [Escherichia coli]